MKNIIPVDNQSNTSNANVNNYDGVLVLRIAQMLCEETGYGMDEVVSIMLDDDFYLFNHPGDCNPAEFKNVVPVYFQDNKCFVLAW